jgi:hypothetical protein
MFNEKACPWVRWRATGDAALPDICLPFCRRFAGDGVWVDVCAMVGRRTYGQPPPQKALALDVATRVAAPIRPVTGSLRALFIDLSRRSKNDCQAYPATRRYRHKHDQVAAGVFDI